MAHKAGKPVIPVQSAAYWMLPFKTAHNIHKVVVHEPIESEGKTEQ